MSSIPLFSQEALGKIVKILDAPAETDFATLMRMAELDPKKDLKGGDYSGVDFAEVDISEWNLRDTKLTGANLSKVKNIKLAKFSKRTDFSNAELPEGVTVEELKARKSKRIVE